LTATVGSGSAAGTPSPGLALLGAGGFESAAEVAGATPAPAPGPASSPSASRFELFEQLGRDLVAGLELRRRPELTERRLAVPLGQVVVREQEVRGRRVGVVAHEGFQAA